MKKELSRRKALKAMGWLTAASALPASALSNIIEKEYIPDYLENYIRPKKPVTCITLGAGNRGNVYGNYAAKFPEDLNVVGVAEPIPIRRERYSTKHNISADKQFVTWEDVFRQPKFADAVLITTPDHLHYGPAMKALEMGYDLLLEKPIAQSWQECNDILQQAKKYNRIVAVCHVLRYSPYYKKVKEVIDSGVLGDLVSVQHFEPIQHVHMSHSFVRGIWRREEDSNPIILAKSCHDMDMLRWWIGRNCLQIGSFGSLKLFKEANAPEGAPARCTDGCPIEKDCPYSALKIYYRNRTWLHHFDLPEKDPERGEAILKNLKEGQYGRCVYRCDNDVADHQVCIMDFDDQITATFNMEAFTHYHGRRTRIMGTMGDIVGDEQDLLVTNFRNGEVEKWNVKENAEVGSGHGGGDWGLVRDWIMAVDQQNPDLLTSTLDASMESHLMAFQAERSRKGEGIVKVEV
ncbi:MAG: Gfo/Idh/MocA family oxidoreductase [Saprospiraceae bacterium]|nr:Gfo/Idh/MocA family oxidoreductase [Saprospiraceae bacterium]